MVQEDYMYLEHEDSRRFRKVGYYLLISTAPHYRRLTVDVFRPASTSHTVLSLQKPRARSTETYKHTTVLRLTEVERGFGV